MRDRPDRTTSATIEIALLMPRAQAIQHMNRARVSFSVMGRVLDQFGQRRSTDCHWSAVAGQQSPLGAGTRK